MSEYYNARRKRNLYNPDSEKSFKISRSKIELFIECPRCFYLDRKLGVGRPPGFPFALNSAVDELLKKEFDLYRKNREKHPLIKQYQVDAVPVEHEKLDQWRNNFIGIQFHHLPTNLLVFGAIDDLWQDSEGNYIIVDYKATSKDEEIVELDKDWQISYKRQMEIYQWLFRANGYDVHDTGYFVYCNGRTDKEAFDAKLEFKVEIIPYKGSDRWVEGTIQDIKTTLDSNKVPEIGENCDFCQYCKSINNFNL